MGRAGARSQCRRAPARPRYRPGEVFFWAGILLCVAFGATVAGINEAARAGDQGWVWFFAGMAAVDVGLYLWVVTGWVDWIND